MQPRRSIANWRTVIYSTLGWFAVPMAMANAQGVLDQKTVRFVSDVICHNEFKVQGEWQTNRWNKSPTLSTFGPDSHHPTVIANVVKQINECLPDQYQIELLEPNNTDAHIKVYFVALSEFPTVAKEHEIRYVDGNMGFFDVSWNNRFEIQKASILIAHDKLRGRRLHHFVLEEITQSLGLSGDSKRFEDSVFYEDQSKGEYGTTSRLSKLDKKTIRFFYTHVKPGSHPIEVGIQMARHW